jgi:hypothetical protein
MHGKANLAGRFADDLDDDPGRVGHSFGDIGAIGEYPLDERISPARRSQQRDGAVAVLNGGWMDLQL